MLWLVHYRFFSHLTHYNTHNMLTHQETPSSFLFNILSLSPQHLKMFHAILDFRHFSMISIFILSKYPVVFLFVLYPLHYQKNKDDFMCLCLPVSFKSQPPSQALLLIPNHLLGYRPWGYNIVQSMLTPIIFPSNLGITNNRYFVTRDEVRQHFIKSELFSKSTSQT